MTIIELINRTLKGDIVKSFDWNDETWEYDSNIGDWQSTRNYHYFLDQINILEKFTFPVKINVNIDDEIKKLQNMFQYLNKSEYNILLDFLLYELTNERL